MKDRKILLAQVEDIEGRGEWGLQWGKRNWNRKKIDLTESD